MKNEKFGLRHFLPAALLLLAGGFAACSSDNEELTNEEAPGVSTLTMRASVAKGDSKVVYEDDDVADKTYLYWSDGDAYTLHWSGGGDLTYTFTETNATGESGSADFAYTGTLPSIPSGTTIRAFYPAKDLPASASSVPMDFSTQAGTSVGLGTYNLMEAEHLLKAGESLESVNLSFRHAVAIVRLKLTHEAFKSAAVTSVTFRAAGLTSKATYTPGATVGGGTWAVADGSTSAVTATGPFTGDASGTVTVYLALPTGVALSDCRVTAVCGSTVYETSLGGKTLEAGKLYRVAKDDMTPSAIAYITNPAQARKGDLALDDGTFLANSVFTGMSTAEQAVLKSRVRGIVFWTTADTDLTDANRQTPAKLSDDEVMAADYPGCTHGLIVSLMDVSAGTVWQATFGSVAAFQTGGKFTDANKDKYQSIVTTDVDDARRINTILGYQQTKLLKAYNASLSESESNKKVLPVSLLDAFSNANPAPLNTTGWFIPSEKELHMLCYKDVDDVWNTRGSSKIETRDLMNGLLATLGKEEISDTYYWSSSENNDYYAWGVDFSEANALGYMKFDSYRLRAICAF